MAKLIRVSVWTFVPLAIVVAIVFAFPVNWPNGSETEIPLSQLVSLAVEGRVQEIRVQQPTGGIGSTARQVRFAGLLDDGDEVIGRAEAPDAIRIALDQAGVADVDALLILE